MSRYRTIAVKIWADEIFSEMTSPPPCAQSLYIYLLTNPFTTPIPGLYKASIAAMAEDLGWPLESNPKADKKRNSYGKSYALAYGFQDALSEVIKNGLVQVDFRTKVFYLPNCIKYSPPQSTNAVKSWASHWDEIPNCTLKAQAYQHFQGMLLGISQAFRDAFVMACSKPKDMPCGKACAIQEQEQEQDKEQDKSMCASDDARTLVPLQIAPTQKQLGEMFEKIWEVYPNKKNRKRAFEIFLRKRIHPQTEEIIAAVKKFTADDVDWQDGFVPLLTTFFNGERWHDKLRTQRAKTAADSGGFITSENIGDVFEEAKRKREREAAINESAASNTAEVA